MPGEFAKNAAEFTDWTERALHGHVRARAQEPARPCLGCRGDCARSLWVNDDDRIVLLRNVWFAVYIDEMS